jgi:NTE family protein
MSRSALVLGGGGTVGLAWEAGVVAGLQAEGCNLFDVGILLGTSAGSYISTLIGHRVSPADSLPEPPDDPSAGPFAAEPALPSDLASLLEILALWSQAEKLDAGVRKQIADLALAADAFPEDVFDAMVGTVTSREWPASLRITVVDTADGAFEVLNHESGVPLDRAIAASCSVPGIFSPTTIGEKRYIDGGVRSGTSADTLIHDAPERVLIVAPLSVPDGPGIGPIMDRTMREEIAQLEAAGIATHAIVPNDTDLAAFGPNMMDNGRRDEALAAGRSRGKSEAALILEAWGSFP